MPASRLSVLTWGVGALAAVVGITGCGAPPPMAGADVSVASTDWVTYATTSTTDVTETTLAPPQTGTLLVTQRYIVISEDTSRRFVAAKCGVTVEELDEANKKTKGYDAFYIGLEIRIPAGALAGCTGPIVTTTTSEPATDPASVTTTTSADPCARETYVIVAGDLPSKVAARYGVTVEQLDKANERVNGYANFVAGIRINIPGPSC